jgi:hypothetical protein
VRALQRVAFVVNIKALHRRLLAHMMLYRMARHFLRVANSMKFAQGAALQDCRDTRNQLLNTMLELRIALAVRAARRGTK